MRHVCGNDRTWSGIRRDLESSGVILNDRVAIEKKKSFSYRLSDEWSGRESFQYAVRDKRLSLVLDEQEQARRDREGWLPVHYHLERIVQRARIDKESASTWIAEQPVHIQAQCRLIGEILESGQPFLTRDAYGRFHTPISRMPRGLRVHALSSGRRCSTSDVSSCQPHLLGLSCLPGFPLRSVLAVRSLAPLTLGKKQREGVPSLVCGSSVAPLYYVQPLDANLSPVDPSVEDFLGLTSTGNYYREFAGIHGMPFDSDEEIRDVKTESCRAMFGRKGPSAAFRKRWPVAAAKIMSLHSPSYKNVAWTYQRYESYLMIECVCGVLMREHPEIPVLTIHDALMVPPEHTDTVRGVILAEWSKVGTPPSLKTSR